MGLKNLSTWIRQTLGGQGTGPSKVAGGAGSQVGKQVLTNEGAAIGTVTAVWRGTDASDHAQHENTLGVQRHDQGEGGLLYIPSSAIAQESAQDITLMVDMSQVASRGWRFRPTSLSEDNPVEAPVENAARNQSN